MQMSEDRKRYLKDYRQSSLKRVPLDVSQEFYERIKNAADAEGKSVNGFIKWLLEKYFASKGF